jgi:hypothetical protein
MNADKFAEKLKELNACSDAIAWATGKSLTKAWQECHRPDWMMWLLGRSTVSKKVIATIAVGFAEQCVHNATKYPDVAKCIEVIKRFLAGNATQEELSAARSAAWSAAESAAWSAASAARSAAWSAAWSAASASSAARSAADSAASAARSAASAASAAESAASAASASSAAQEELSAARSAAWSAESAARSAARSAAGSANCDIIRKHVSPDEITSLLK